MREFVTHTYAERVGKWAVSTFGNLPNYGPTLAAAGLAEEVGEVCRCVVKEQQGIRGTSDEWRRELRKELGDVFVRLAELSRLYHLDLVDAIIERANYVMARDLNHDPIGGDGA